MNGSIFGSQTVRARIIVAGWVAVAERLQNGGQFHPALERTSVAVIVTECAADRFAARVDLELQSETMLAHVDKRSRPDARFASGETPSFRPERLRQGAQSSASRSSEREWMPRLAYT